MALCTLPAWRPPQIDQGGLETSLQTQAHLEVEVLQPVTFTKLMFSQCWRCSHPRGRGRQLKLSLTATAPKQNNLPAASTAGAQRWCSRMAAKQLTFVAAVTGSSETPGHTLWCSAAAWGWSQLSNPSGSLPLPCTFHKYWRRVAVGSCSFSLPALLLLAAQTLLRGFAHFPTPFPTPAELLKCHA